VPPVSAQAGQKQKLVIAVQPTFAVAEMMEKVKPLEKFLEERLGDVDVEIYIPLSQAGVVEALRFGHAQVAFMGPWAAQLAVELAGAELPLAEVREVSIESKKAEATYYFSYWVVPAESPYKSLGELRGRKACFPSPVSGSGYVAPMGRLVELQFLSARPGNEADPKQFFSDVLFAGGYGQCWQALQAGTVDVTIIAGDVPERLYNEVLSKTCVLEKQGPLPSHAVVVSRDFRDPLRGRVLDALVALGAPEHRPMMRQFISGIFTGFQPATAEKHLGAFKQYLNLTGLRFTERIGR
jgi:phosphonate transport system substrate-binding protein